MQLKPDNTLSTALIFHCAPYKNLNSALQKYLWCSKWECKEQIEMKSPNERPSIMAHPVDMATFLVENYG